MQAPTRVNTCLPLCYLSSGCSSEFRCKAQPAPLSAIPPLPQVLCDTKELVSSRVADVKDAVSSKVLEVMDVSREALQSSTGAARPAVPGAAGVILEPGVGHTGVCGAEAVLGTAGGDSLPIGNEELGKERVSVAIEMGIIKLGAVSPIPHPTTLEWG